MTKKVRIENADTSSYRVLVQVWDKGYTAGEPDTLVQEKELNFPCDLSEFGITNTRYLIVKEI